MSASDTIKDDGLLDRMAAEWLYEQEDGFTPERAQSFAEWRGCDPRHAEALVRIERTLALLREGPAVRVPLEARMTGTTASPEFHARRQLAVFPGLAWAAGIAAVLAICAGVWWNFAPSTPAEQRFTTDTSAQRTMTLSDGSIIDINTGSEIAVQMTAHERHVTIRNGEAYFQVAHDSTRPFIVTAGDVSVRAVGTAFNVRVGAQAVNVLVTEGKVQLDRDQPGSNRQPIGTVPLLTTGDLAQVSHADSSAGLKIEKIDETSIRALLRWQNPLTDFVNVPLRDVVARINRRNTIQLILEDADLGERKIGGMIALDQVDAFVRLLEQDGEIIAERRTDDRIGLRRAR